MSSYAVTKLLSALTLWTVNRGGSASHVLIHSRIASLRFTVLSPTMVQVTSSAQNERKPSTPPSTRDAFTFSTISLFLLTYESPFCFVNALIVWDQPTLSSPHTAPRDESHITPRAHVRRSAWQVSCQTSTYKGLRGLQVVFKT